MRKLLVLALTLALVVGVASVASATAVTVGWSQDFDSYSLAYNSRTDVGNYAPLWNARTNPFYYGRIGGADAGYAWQDVQIVRDTANRQYLRTEDDAGIFINISTLGYQDATFDFKWWTSNTSGNDHAEYGVYVGDLDIASLFDSPGGGWTDDNLRNLFNVTDLGTHNNGFTWGSIDLADNAESIWIFLALNDGEHNYAHFDCMSISGTEIPSQVPIPGAVWLLGSGLVGLAGLKRKYIG